MQKKAAQPELLRESAIHSSTFPDLDESGESASVHELWKVA
jgi:hypothetical protein